ncbi:hypothetical protein CEP52_005869 [Fusarium oligoseptatum]|uniref:BTB domain-containing protein n=1 Tax=Fusarium oligoseptatum TaxID=2604345 RepID=A0A428TVW0_9HYPO|nr:hypothetical protein CEP52_005869 [Fusarium oligoseptatum]
MSINTESMLKRVTVDPDGDLVLVSPYDPQTDAPSKKASEKEDQSKSEEEEKEVTIQLEDRELLVSSKILSNASPVFQAMLDGRFLEGVQLSNSKASPDREPYRLLLPDDDYTAMLLLCRVLHFKFKGIPDQPRSNLLLALAGVCDKYQCTQTLKYCGALWLRNWTASLPDVEEGSIENISRLLIFAYVADLPHEFCEVAWMLVLHHEGPIAGPQTQAIQLIDHPLLPSGVGRYLDQKRLQFCEAYHRAVTGPWTTWQWTSLTSGCYRASHAISEYTLTLRGAGIVPYELDLRDHTFSHLLKAAKSLPLLTVRSCTSRYNCGCSGDRTDSLTRDLQALARNIPKHKTWFGCLDCFKSGDMSGKDRKCRMEHGDITKYNLLV